ncbi:hypothetical protein E4M14_022320 [Enterobacter sp. Z1]|nr:hypothetical protein E4M14_022320 [Enterobacter sp. Z1]
MTVWLRFPAKSQRYRQLHQDGHHRKEGQGDGPLRLPARVAVRSSSPTPPGSCFAPASLRRTPSGFGLR